MNKQNPAKKARTMQQSVLSRCIALEDDGEIPKTRWELNTPSRVPLNTDDERSLLNASVTVEPCISGDSHKKAIR